MNQRTRKMNCRRHANLAGPIARTCTRTDEGARCNNEHGFEQFVKVRSPELGKLSPDVAPSTAWHVDRITAAQCVVL